MAEIDPELFDDWQRQTSEQLDATVEVPDPNDGVSEDEAVRRVQEHYRQQTGADLPEDAARELVRTAWAEAEKRQ
jgi:hypothetical protein